VGGEGRGYARWRDLREGKGGVGLGAGVDVGEREVFMAGGMFEKLGRRSIGREE
jgi:hypothetical protein